MEVALLYCINTTNTAYTAKSGSVWSGMGDTTNTVMTTKAHTALMKQNINCVSSCIVF